MKLFELYNKQSVTETKTLRASIKLCEGMVKVLNEYNRPDSFDGDKITKGVDAMFAKNQKRQPLRSIWNFVSGNWQEFEDILTGSTRSGFSKLKRQGFTYDEINELRRMAHRVVGGFFKRINYGNVNPNKGIFHGWNTDITGMSEENWDKLHTEITANLKQRFGTEEGLEEAEYDNGIDFQAQPDFANVKGVNIDDNRQRIAGQQDSSKQEKQKLNKAWVMLLSKMKNLDKEQRKKLRPHLQKVANAASKRRIALIPSPEQVFNL